MKDQKPLIEKYTKKVEVNGKKYKLIHPGMRFVNRWRRESMHIVDGKGIFDMEKYFDFAFEHCVEPIDHNFRPDQDNIMDPKEGEEWARLLPRFLRGDDIEDFQGKKEKKESQKAS